jgi:hypothetical protein
MEKGRPPIDDGHGVSRVFILTATQNFALKLRSEILGLSAAEIVRRAIDEWLKNHEKDRPSPEVAA